jgi:hypothetical protein
VRIPQKDSDELWPHGGQKSDADKLFEAAEQLAAEVGDGKAGQTVSAAKQEYAEVKKIVGAPDPGVLLDMPDDVLDGSLGDLYLRRMVRFPVAYAWPALLTVASALVPQRTENRRFNLYTALVGPYHSGKSQAIQWAQSLLRIESPTLLDVMAGSAEGLIRKCKDAAGNPRLFSPDELGHLLEKAKIQHASFAYVLNRAFYTDKFEVLMGRGQAATFHASLSILGGLVTDKFEDLFGAATTGGLYDRFIFGAYPGKFVFEYFPFDDSLVESFSPVPVFIDEDVWAAKAAWRVEDPELEPRVAEIAIRAAAVAASFDGRSRLRVEDLGPARAFADYQMRIRRLLKPNAGENPEGKIALKILAHLDRLQGRYVAKRTLLREINAYRFGPSVAERALSVLFANGDIEITKTRPELVRRIADPEQSVITPIQERETHT